MTATGDLEAGATAAGRRLRCAAGLVFVFLIIFAPLNFGSTRRGGPELLTSGCVAATLLWAASLMAGGPRCQVPPAAAGSATLLTLAALPWIFGFATATSVTPFTQVHFAHVAARWPYSIVWRTPANTLTLTLALSASCLAVADLARSRVWVLAFSVALAGTAVAVGALALLQNYTHATGIYWRHDGRMPGNFCGTFFHHTAAGAYFNTAWPLAFALSWLAWDRPRPLSAWPPLAVAGIVGLIVLLAAHASHVSRFPQVAGVLVSPFLLLASRPRGRRPWWVIAGVTAAVIVLIAAAGRTATIGERWKTMFDAPPAGLTPARLPESAWPALIRDDLFIPHTSQSGWFGDRGESWRTAWRSIAERPFTGHGPGNWIGAASHHTDDPFVRTFFQFLQFTHQDVLQFAVEWGLPAMLGWWSLLVGGIVAVLRVTHWRTPMHRPLGIAAACALGAVLLQAQIDFPLEIPAVAFNAVVLAGLCWAGAATTSPKPALPA